MESGQTWIGGAAGGLAVFVVFARQGDGAGLVGGVMHAVAGGVGCVFTRTIWTGGNVGWCVRGQPGDGALVGCVFTRTNARAVKGNGACKHAPYGC